MTKTPRERAREQTMAEILSIGRAQLAVHGAAGLSLRAVARELGVVSSAVYRYVKNRDELLTLLLVDGYNALGDAVDRAVDDAVDEAGHDDFLAQLRALGHAVREWALAEPARYGLLFGAPVPGYEAPANETTAPGTRVVLRLVHLIEGAYHAGAMEGHMQGQTVGSATARKSDPALAQTPSANFAAVRAELGLEVPDDVLARGILVWAALFGAVNFEVFGQYGATTFADPGALFELHLDSLAKILGLQAAGTHQRQTF
ncbi:TetR/AcrR family transcriptional regulator [Arthrobacter sp.]|uniref:TetR/AcrR family transcriptional regulator n=1 Tax=Arthrobacter sp. TaxID=1667 RepID=UPI0026DFED98|nr:TetR/AcrR family transcriptional regulator [Arthrobacter sp.]MDO5751730.1 TetR/AcrR family transcriptional regulator [Arthrobacter sp.]